MRRVLPSLAVTLTAAAVYAQPLEAVIHLSFVEVDDVTGKPVPDPNGIIERGEAALFRVSVSFAPPVGTVLSPPPQPGKWTVHAFRTTCMLVVEGQGPHAAGTWSGLQIGGGMTGFPGVPDPEGRLVWGLSFGQQAVGANQGNPVKDVWQGIWRPEEYTERTVLFGVFSPCSGGPSVATTLWLHDPNAPEPYIAAVAADTFYETVHVPIGLGPDPCYANCDNSTTEPVLNVDDFTCFISEFAAAQALPPAQQIEHYANCDGSTTEPILNVDDFTCFIDAFAQGCP